MRLQNAFSLLALSCHWTTLVHAIDGSFSAEAVETNAGWSAAELDLIFAQSTPEYEPDMPSIKADKSETTNKYNEIFALDNKLVSSKQKQKAVKDAFVFAWEGYKKYSWGADENKPVSKGTENSRNGWGATIVDALDTLYIMNLHEDFAKATNFVAAIDWSSSDVTMEVQVFETVIRYVGGLLSAYDLSGNPVFVERARDLVERLLPAFDTPTGIPYHSIHLDTGRPSMNGYIKTKYLGTDPVDISNYVSILSEAGTVQLELNRLSDITGDPKYHLAGKKVIDFLEKVQPLDVKGILPVFLDPETGHFKGDYITWGGLGDSYYEYLAKQYVYSGGRDEQAKRMFIDVIRSTEKYMVSSPKNHTQHKLLGNLRGNLKLEPVMDELACFAPGTFLLAARNIDELRDIEPLAADILDSCVLAWTSTRTGIAPEVFGWIDEKTGRHNAPIDGRTEELAREFGVFPITKSYILRPETIESIFYFYRFTKNETYREMGWELFKAVQQHCRANSGFSGIIDVDAVSPKWDDREESFFFAETLKYFYLLFDDTNLLPLDEWVLNTEAHPLRIQK